LFINNNVNRLFPASCFKSDELRHAVRMSRRCKKIHKL